MSHLLRRSHDEALLTGVPGALGAAAGCSGTAVQAEAPAVGGPARASLSSLGSGILPMPVEALPTEVFLRWPHSDRLDERE